MALLNSSYLETRLKLTSFFPDFFMVDRAILFTPVSHLENATKRHKTTSADTNVLHTDKNSSCFLSSLYSNPKSLRKSAAAVNIATELQRVTTRATTFENFFLRWNI